MFSGPQQRGKARNLCQEVNLFPLYNQLAQVLLNLHDISVGLVMTMAAAMGDVIT